MNARKQRMIVLALSMAVLTGCAQQTALQPAPGNTLPVAVYGETRRPQAEELLERLPQAAPERNIELRTRSEPREADPFDLPPEL
ncbi:hypothetical protein RM533_03600 [Croceicoccus sp. F390]|uniref:Argininosuccinate lyase n=1 Tax=Croceicoccus esteveae TaxID=3075597 RepID=A0ABU2ZFT7_9SPHN|nr:hypothetical protein [Croceicoccus sp. F390]MDT0575265.1 hypothetical protein [Croceicoccus sp. F390]